MVARARAAGVTKRRLTRTRARSIRVQQRPEHVGAVHSGAEAAGLLGQPPVRGDDPHQRRAGLCAQPAHDLVVGGVAARLGRVGHLDHGRADRRRGLALEDDDHVLALGCRPALEQVDEAQHGRVAVAPPAVRPRADHVHPVDVPAHRGVAGSARRRRRAAPVALALGLAALGVQPRVTEPCVGRVAWRGRRGASAAVEAVGRRWSASSRLRVWLRSSWATATTRGPRRAMIRRFCSSVSASEAATSNDASIRDAVDVGVLAARTGGARRAHGRSRAAGWRCLARDGIGSSIAIR